MFLLCHIQLIQKKTNMKLKLKQSFIFNFNKKKSLPYNMEANNKVKKNT